MKKITYTSKLGGQKSGKMNYDGFQVMADIHKT